MPVNYRHGAVAAGLALALLTGCSSSSSPTASRTSTASSGAVTPPSSVAVSASSGQPSGAAGQVAGTVVVFAAASLTGTFTTLAKQFEAAHPGVNAKLNFGASSALALQLNAGAAADVFASASTKNMAQVVSAGGASTSVAFARNTMEIAVPPGNPAHLAALADLAKAGVKVALCQPQVPCGAAARAVFANAKLSVKPVTLEADVKSTLTKVELDEVDAGVVYVTDVRAAGSKVMGIEIPESVNASTKYPIAQLTEAPNPAAAAAFQAFVLSPAGQEVLSEAGFGKP